jgi:hypothetical protein
VYGGKSCQNGGWHATTTGRDSADGPIGLTRGGRLERARVACRVVPQFRSNHAFVAPPV